jgi:6-pyruvoyltetrahydropterin/6-carboxytetrahydropterin synthase
MYELKIISHFAAAHRLRDFQGACENLHGHNWKIEVYVQGKELGRDGILCDFKVIKEKTEKILKQLDHTYLNELSFFKEQNPSSENIAKFIFYALSKELNNKNIKVTKVTAWESETACASYYE